MRITTVFLVLAALVAACATVSRDTFIRQKTGEHVYEAKVEDVWPHVRALFEEQGYDVMNAQGEFALETGWREEMAGSKVAGYWHRYLALGVPLKGGRCQVRIVRLSKAAADHTQYPDEGRGASGQRTQRAATGSGETPPSGNPADAAGGEGYSSVDLMYQADDHSQSRLKNWAGSRDGERDFALEYLLMQRIDPESAAEIHQAARAL